MNTIKEGVRSAIVGNTELVALLRKNLNPYNKTLPAAKAYSVVDYLNAADMAPPFLTIRADTENLSGRTHMTDAFVLIRCYNEKDKTFYTINEVMSRVRKLLDGKRFPVEGYATVEIVWETTSAELLDEALDMRYREMQFRVQLT